jgi:hypothetical protein
MAGEKAALTRGTLDLGDLKHYVWRSPSGETFDLLIAAEVIGGRLVVRDAHLMPQSGTFLQIQWALGRLGLRQLARDLGTEFAVNLIEIPTRIDRTTGRIGGFGPGVFSVP